jgi:hypothetical protein
MRDDSLREGRVQKGAGAAVAHGCRVPKPYCHCFRGDLSGRSAVSRSSADVV